MEITKDKYDHSGYKIDGRSAFISFVWQVKAKVCRRRSGTTRIHEYEVVAATREMADYALRKHYKGGMVTEVQSLVPYGFWKNSFWIDDLTSLSSEILNQLELPTDL